MSSLHGNLTASPTNATFPKGLLRHHGGQYLFYKADYLLGGNLALGGVWEIPMTISALLAVPISSSPRKISSTSLVPTHLRANGKCVFSLFSCKIFLFMF